MSVLQRQILLTLGYSNVFSKPLTTEEIAERLILPSNVQFFLANDRSKILTELRALKGLGLVKKHDQFWQLASISENLSGLRRRREGWSKQKLDELQPLLNFCRNIPWVLGVAVTGSVSVLNAEAKDDTDLMIVTSRRRLWLVRPLLVFFSFLKGKRRSWNHEEENSWCLNLWLDETELVIQPAARNVYIAYEVLQARWVIARAQIDTQFLVKNAWVADFLVGVSGDKKRLAKKFVLPASNQIVDLLNYLAYKLQRWYMQSHITKEKVCLTAAFFHPRDTRKGIVSKLSNLFA